MEKKLEVKRALEKLDMDLPFKGNTESEVLTKKVSSALEVPCSKRILPRAVVFKARDKDFDKIKELIKSQFPDVEIVYVTTGSAECFLRVTKSVPFEAQDFSSRSLYTVEGL